MAKHVLVSGSSGLIGTALCTALRERGDEVRRLVRRPTESADEVQWNPASRYLAPSELDGVDVVVNLAGAGIGDKRWDHEFKKTLITSRTDSTTALAEAIAAHDKPVQLVNGSAVGYYGDRGDEELTEESRGGTGFLAELVRAWEGAAEPARAAGAPVAYLRTGIVLAADSPAMSPLLKLTKLGLGGPLGDGAQFWPWITLADHVRSVLHVIDDGLTGPINLSAPEPARQKDLVAELGNQLHRPTVLPAPKFALRAVVGEMAEDITASQRMLPARLLETGFTFEHPSVSDAVTWLLADQT